MDLGVIEKVYIESISRGGGSTWRASSSVFRGVVGAERMCEFKSFGHVCPFRKHPYTFSVQARAFDSHLNVTQLCYVVQSMTHGCTGVSGKGSEDSLPNVPRIKRGNAFMPHSVSGIFVDGFAGILPSTP